MRHLGSLIIAALVIIWSAPAGLAAGNPPPSSDRVLKWITTYRTSPDHKLVPAAVKAVSHNGDFQEPEAAGVYVGFLAGVIGANPDQADRLIEAMLPIRPEDHWVLVKAVAYSGLPEWREVLGRHAGKMPNRQVMIDAYVSGKLPILDQFGLPHDPGFFDRLGRTFSGKPDKIVLEPTPAVVDTLWGYYYATGAVWPLAGIVSLLAWSRDANNVDRLTLGSSAKFQLARNASRDAELLAALKEARQRTKGEVAAILDEVIFAAETVEIGAIRNEAMAALNELRGKGPAYKRQIAWWGRMGEGALSLGCIAAAVTGQVHLGIPCVIGGALTSATLRYLAGS